MVLRDAPQRAQRVMSALRVLRAEAQHVAEEDNEDGSKGEEEEACVHAAEDEEDTCSWEEVLLTQLNREEDAGYLVEDMEEDSRCPGHMVGAEEGSVEHGERLLLDCKDQVPNVVESEQEVVEMEVSPFVASSGLAAKLPG